MGDERGERRGEREREERGRGEEGGRKRREGGRVRGDERRGGRRRGHRGEVQLTALVPAKTFNPSSLISTAVTSPSCSVNNNKKKTTREYNDKFKLQSFPGGMIKLFNEWQR